MRSFGQLRVLVGGVDLDLTGHDDMQARRLVRVFPARSSFSFWVQNRP